MLCAQFHRSKHRNLSYYYIRFSILFPLLSICCCCCCSNTLFLQGKLNSRHIYTLPHWHCRVHPIYVCVCVCLCVCTKYISESLKHSYVRPKLIFRNGIFEGIKRFETGCDKLRIKHAPSPLSILFCLYKHHSLSQANEQLWDSTRFE